MTMAQITRMRGPQQTAFRSAGCRVVRPARTSMQCSASANNEGASWHAVLRNGVLSALAAACLAVPIAPIPPFQNVAPAEAALSARDPIKNARAILRYALPIDNKAIRTIQQELESVSDALRIPGSKSLGPIARAVRKSSEVLSREKTKIVGAFASDKKAAGLAAIDALEKSLSEFQGVIEAKDKQAVPIVQQQCLAAVGDIEAAMVNGFPFTVPAEYSNLPQLKGRATINMDVLLKQTATGEQRSQLLIVVDGYSAPVTAGNFVDLVQRGFYNGMEIQRADGFVVQTGDPDGPADGFIDPATKKVRTVPLEILVKGDKEPVYEFSLEEIGRVNEQPVLPFNAFGTLAMARGEFENNSASSQVFWLLKESELTPSSANLLDGRFAVFGYVVEGQELLQEMKVGDEIIKAEVIEGGENLVKPKTAAPEPQPGVDPEALRAAL